MAASQTAKNPWDIEEAFSHFVSISLTLYQAQDALSRRLRALEQGPTEREAHILAAALEYLEQAREGFFLSLKAGMVPDRAELAYLLKQGLSDWDWIEELGIKIEAPTELARVRAQLIAFAMAAVAIGMMPKLPPDRSTFPRLSPFVRPGYSDIPVPRSPAQWLDRIEEVEQITWRAGVAPVADVETNSLRRTYGFYETGTWLAIDHLQRFGLLPRDVER
ncbi:MAG: hypothetical protein Kow0047_33610 [Anaerolineae bacterium]